MASRITLNDNVVFDSEASSLIVLTEGHRVVKLNQPVARCLQLLLERYPATVAHRDFFTYIWGEEASQIPVNALYQNISLLRRSLKSASASLAEVVITVPRTGFRLSSEMKVQQESAAEPHAQEALLPPEADVQVSKTPVAAPLGGRKTFLATALVGLLLVTGLLLALYSVRPTDNSNIIFDTYTLATEHNGCNIYTYPDFAQNNTAELNSYFKKFNIVCTLLTNAYLSVNTARTRVSVMYCDKPVFQAQTCVTHIYWNDN